jgi:hypothetical protein
MSECLWVKSHLRKIPFSFSYRRFLMVMIRLVPIEMNWEPFIFGAEE